MSVSDDNIIRWPVQARKGLATYSVASIWIKLRRAKFRQRRPRQEEVGVEANLDPGVADGVDLVAGLHPVLADQDPGRGKVDLGLEDDLDPADQDRSHEEIRGAEPNALTTRRAGRRIPTSTWVRTDTITTRMETATTLRKKRMEGRRDMIVITANRRDINMRHVHTGLSRTTPSSATSAERRRVCASVGPAGSATTRSTGGRSVRTEWKDSTRCPRRNTITFSTRLNRRSSLTLSVRRRKLQRRRLVEFSQVVPKVLGVSGTARRTCWTS